MNLRLFFEKVYWMLAKRVLKKKQKTFADWAAKGYNNTPEVSFIIQSHNKSYSVMRIVSQLRNYAGAEIIVIDDGSEPKHTKALTRFLQLGNEFLIRANDLYENVMYDKTIRFANGKYIVLLQDDDEIKDLAWVDKGVEYFNRYPDMAILGGLNGLEFCLDETEKWGYVDAYKTTDWGNKDFRFVHSVNRAPMLLNKSLFIQHLKHIDFSFAPFQCDDCELCLRAWLSGLKVGWYNAGFKSMVAGGMRIWNKGFMGHQEIKNRKKLYTMYNASVEEISQRVNEANKNL
ncbi:glycosyltransferase [Parabacteroides sp. 52]|uniref:glycosyltransferase n=1 Tax=unclassified Parabacteroides TaxID=2649774 RepID=UPI0013D461B7|nr:MULTISPECIES: glycosyltransferase [unclassified Parabacteroides]MDH6534236.1 glycosyltransferase involved in cell wall biosynthesis [Parabacteroides sp. PM5-20]NDV55380.1 glycosyltransferase [Parabacteroides sp. 52]